MYLQELDSLLQTNHFTCMDIVNFWYFEYIIQHILYHKQYVARTDIEIIFVQNTE